MDSAGNQASVPTRSYGATITGPDGKSVPASQIAVTWPLRKDGDDEGTDVTDADPLDTLAGAPQARLNVNAAAATPLAAGEYTLKLGVGGLTATQTFTLSGGPANVALSELPETIAEGDRLTLTATLTDADGTAVEWGEQSFGRSTVLIQLRTDRTTTGGQADATWLVITPGSGYVSASAVGIRAICTLTAAAESAPTAQGAAALTSTAPGSFAVWTGAAPISASDLYPLLEGVADIRALPPATGSATARRTASSTQAHSTSTSAPATSSGSAPSSGGAK